MQGNYWEMVLPAAWDSDKVQECKVFPCGLDVRSEHRWGSQDPHPVRKNKPAKHNLILTEESKKLPSECSMEGKRGFGMQS